LWGSALQGKSVQTDEAPPVPSAPEADAVPAVERKNMEIQTDATPEKREEKKAAEPTTSRGEEFGNFASGAGSLMMEVSKQMREMNYENAMIWKGTPVAPTARVKRRYYYPRYNDGGVAEVRKRQKKYLPYNEWRDQQELQDIEDEENGAWYDI
jgi:hypothetical protein